MKRDVVNVNTEALKRLINERYDGSSMRMGRELDLGQTVKNALADGHICKAYARLIELETGVDITEHEEKSAFEQLDDSMKIEFLKGAIDAMGIQIDELEKELARSQSETQMYISGVK